MTCCKQQPKFAAGLALLTNVQSTFADFPASVRRSVAFLKGAADRLDVLAARQDDVAAALAMSGAAAGTDAEARRRHGVERVALAVALRRQCASAIQDHPSELALS